MRKLQNALKNYLDINFKIFIKSTQNETQISDRYQKIKKCSKRERKKNFSNENCLTSVIDPEAAAQTLALLTAFTDENRELVRFLFAY